MSIFLFLAAFLSSAALTFGVRGIMKRLRVVDKPARGTRKIHLRAIPLGGGLAIYGTVVVFGLLAASPGLLGDTVTTKALSGMFLGGLVLMIGGLLDDAFSLRPRLQFIFPVFVSILFVSLGFFPTQISWPFGDPFLLLSPLFFGITVGHLVGIFWLLGTMYTTKFLDGLDGLVAGVVAIGSLVIVFLTRTAPWSDPELSLLALLMAAACLGFLVWNRHPATIFLGEGGSLLLGFWLGALALLSESKITTIALILAVPILDVLRVVIRRYERKQPVFLGDKEHLHYKLLDSGLTHRQTVLFFYGVSLFCGLAAFLLQIGQRLVALAIVFGLVCFVSMWMTRKEGRGFRS